MNYYVVAQIDNKMYYLLGPFTTQAGARAYIASVKEFCIKNDARAKLMKFGTALVKRDKPGSVNSRFRRKG